MGMNLMDTEKDSVTLACITKSKNRYVRLQKSKTKKF